LRLWDHRFSVFFPSLLLIAYWPRSSEAKTTAGEAILRLCRYPYKEVMTAIMTLAPWRASFLQFVALKLGSREFLRTEIAKF